MRKQEALVAHADALKLHKKSPEDKGDTEKDQEGRTAKETELEP